MNQNLVELCVDLISLSNKYSDKLNPRDFVKCILETICAALLKGGATPDQVKNVMTDMIDIYLNRLK